jgi:hypothetical protein
MGHDCTCYFCLQDTGKQISGAKPLTTLTKPSAVVTANLFEHCIKYHNQDEMYHLLYRSPPEFSRVKKHKKLFDQHFGFSHDLLKGANSVRAQVQKVLQRAATIISGDEPAIDINEVYTAVVNVRAQPLRNKLNTLFGAALACLDSKDTKDAIGKLFVPKSSKEGSDKKTVGLLQRRETKNFFIHCREFIKKMQDRFANFDYSGFSLHLALRGGCTDMNAYEDWATPRLWNALNIFFSAGLYWERPFPPLRGLTPPQVTLSFADWPLRAGLKELVPANPANPNNLSPSVPEFALNDVGPSEAI